MNKRSQRGSITVEATIALTAFLFMFMMVYSVVTITRAEAKIGVAINNVAKEISQYSYIYGLTGLNDSQIAINKAGASTKENINDTVKKVSETFDAIQLLRSDGEKASDAVSSAEEKISNLTSFDESTWDTINAQMEEVKAKTETVVDDVEAVLAAGTEVRNNLEMMAENPKELMFGLANILAGQALDIAKSRLIAEPVARGLVKKNLKRTPTDNVDDCLQSLGVVPGTNFRGEPSYLHGIDFSHSMLFPEGNDDIVIIAKYKLKLFRFLPVDIEFNITQVASTVGWLKGDGGEVQKVPPKEDKSSPTPKPTPTPTYGTEGEENRAEIDKLTEEDRAKLLLDLTAKYGDDIEWIYKDYGIEALFLINKYGDDAYLMISSYGADIVRVTRDYGRSGLNALKEFKEYRVELLDMIIKYGQNAIDITNTYKEDGLMVLYDYHDEIEELDDAARIRFVQIIREKSNDRTIKTIDVVLAKNDISSEKFDELKLKNLKDLTDVERNLIEKIRKSVPTPDENTLMQKVVNIEDFDNLYENKYPETKVGGFVTRAQDVDGLKSYDDMYESLRLDYTKADGTQAFKPEEDEFLGVIKFKTPEIEKAAIPFRDKKDSEANDPDNPFTGNGFTGAKNGDIIPEYQFSEYVGMEDGAELYKVYKDGRQELVAVYDGATKKFVPK